MLVTKYGNSAAVRQAAEACGEASLNCTPKCDPDPYPDYLRKREAAMEMFKHASDLRLTASKLVAEKVGVESEMLRIEAEKEVAGDLAWEQYGPQITKRMGESRTALSETWIARKAVAKLRSRQKPGMQSDGSMLRFRSRPAVG